MRADVKKGSGIFKDIYLLHSLLMYITMNEKVED